jgi:KaiC/GvpD/RAD55 family RecA-like ATPase
MTDAVAIGPLRLVSRDARVRWSGGDDAAVIATGHLGFAAASKTDRVRWLGAFRRLLDGLDTHLQVVIDLLPGSEGAIETHPVPVDFDEMHAADAWFADQVSRSQSACRRAVSFVIAEQQASRLESALREIGVQVAGRQPAKCVVFGKENAGEFLHQAGWSRSWYIDRLPGTELEPGWLFRLLPPGLRLSLSWHATPLPTGWIIDYLQRQLVSMRATRLQQDSAAAADPLLAGAVPAAESLQRRLAASQEKAFHVATYLTLTASTRDELEAGAERVQAFARAALCRLQPCKFRMLDGYLATRPIGLDRLQRNRVLDTSSLATFLPWLDADLQEPGGLVIGRNRASGCPVLVDPFDHRRYANANMAVFGHSGAGKTYLLSTVAMGALGRGTQVYIIDPEHEYGALAVRLGGVDVQLALGSGHALNVLDLRPSARHDEAWLGPASADAVDLCATLCGGLDEPERAHVEAAVRAVYSHQDQPLLADVAARLPEASRVAAVLTRWVQGSLGQMFSAPTNVDLEAPIVVFGMRELREEMIAPVHFLLAEALWTRIKRKDRRRTLIIDELGLLFEDPTIRRFVVSLARRIRKYSGALVFATQNPGDLLSSDAGAVVATNPALVFFGAQRPGEAAKLQRTFNLSHQQRTFLESARRGEFLLAAGPDRLAVNVQAPPWQEEAMKQARDADRPPPRTGRLSWHVQRVLHYRLNDLPDHRLERVHAQFEALAAARSWRCDRPWIASPYSRGLFEMEYFRHLRAEHPGDVTAAGFIKMAGDETDALIITIFLRDLSAEYGIKVVLQDEDHPLANLRRLEFLSGRLPSGLTLEDVLANRPVIKKVAVERILFYPPTFKLHSQSPPSPEWAYALYGIRAYAPTLLEAEQEALKILRGFGHLGR